MSYFMSLCFMNSCFMDVFLGKPQTLQNWTNVENYNCHLYNIWTLPVVSIYTYLHPFWPYLQVLVTFLHFTTTRNLPQVTGCTGSNYMKTSSETYEAWSSGRGETTQWKKACPQQTLPAGLDVVPWRRHNVRQSLHRLWLYLKRQ